MHFQWCYCLNNKIPTWIAKKIRSCSIGVVKSRSAIVTKQVIILTRGIVSKSRVIAKRVIGGVGYRIKRCVLLWVKRLLDVGIVADAGSRDYGIGT
jgi:hypothetical protein